MTLSRKVAYVAEEADEVSSGFPEQAQCQKPKFISISFADASGGALPQRVSPDAHENFFFPHGIWPPHLD